MARPVLEVRDLWIGEGSGAACRGVSLVARGGEVVCVLGAEGAGKSRLLRCIGLDFPPSAGTIVLNGTDVSASTAEVRRALRARSIELVHPPAPEGVRDLTVPDPRGGVLFSVTRRRTVPVAGMRQRIQIAKALTQPADVLLLDEPLRGVDQPVQARVVELLDRLRDRASTAVVVATRDPEIALLLSDRAVVLDEGEVVESGPTSAILANPRHDRTREIAQRRRSA